jgi:hypothetical protein
MACHGIEGLCRCWPTLAYKLACPAPTLLASLGSSFLLRLLLPLRLHVRTLQPRCANIGGDCGLAPLPAAAHP